MKIFNTFISGACNTVYKGFDWIKDEKQVFDEIIAYACNNQILIYSPEQMRVMASLNLHKKRVNQVQLIKYKDTILLLSCSNEGLFAVWQVEDLKSLLDYSAWTVKFQFKIGQKQQDQTGFLRFYCNHYENDKLLVSLTQSNGVVKLLYIDDEQILLLDEINFGHNVPEPTCIFPLFQEGEKSELFFIIFGTLDFKLHIYSFDVKDLKQNASQNNDQNNLESKLEYVETLKGHEDAITDLQFINIFNDKRQQQEVFIVSSGKDGYIRLNRLKRSNEESYSQTEGNFQDKNSYRFSVGDRFFEISLESILIAHQNDVTSLQFGLKNAKYQQQNTVYNENDVILLSASFDFSLIIWEKDIKEDLWIGKTRIGQLYGNKNAFFLSLFNKIDFKSIVACTYNGSLYEWIYSEERDMWDALPIITGHFRQVTDIDWSSHNYYLSSCSLDQTTRIFCPTQQKSDKQKEGFWFEVSRAQIHGYDINSVKNLKVKNTEKVVDVLVSAADEKIIRLFEPSSLFPNMINKLSPNHDLRLYFPNKEEEEKYLVKNEEGIVEYKIAVEGGQQVLGLMTKAVKVQTETYSSTYFQGDEEEQLDEIIDDGTVGGLQYDFKQPPVEDYLVRHTLWPELNKLYGHGYELKTIACNHEGTIIASSCKSQNPKHSTIFLWAFTENQNVYILDKLSGHNYTVMQLEFSRDDQYLGSVGRDRIFCLFKKDPSDKEHPYKQIFQNQSHTRVIYTLNFTPDSKYCITGSRDKKLKIWDLNKLALAHEAKLDDSITAVSTIQHQNQYIFAIGLENGEIHIGEYKNSQLTLKQKVPTNLGHSLQINRLLFKINSNNQEQQNYTLASCSDDHTVRIYNIQLD